MSLFPGTPFGAMTKGMSEGEQIALLAGVCAAVYFLILRPRMEAIGRAAGGIGAELGSRLGGAIVPGTSDAGSLHAPRG